VEFSSTEGFGRCISFLPQSVGAHLFAGAVLQNRLSPNSFLTTSTRLRADTVEFFDKVSHLYPVPSASWYFSPLLFIHQRGFAGTQRDEFPCSDMSFPLLLKDFLPSLPVRPMDLFWLYMVPFTPSSLPPSPLYRLRVWRNNTACRLFRRICVKDWLQM